VLPNLCSFTSEYRAPIFFTTYGTSLLFTDHPNPYFHHIIPLLASPVHGYMYSSFSELLLKLLQSISEILCLSVALSFSLHMFVIYQHIISLFITIPFCCYSFHSPTYPPRPFLPIPV
jgi:hypothetical protein